MSTNAHQGVLFAERFLETLAGEKILNSPSVAVIELLANSWDAGATKVEIDWPFVKPDASGKQHNRLFRIKDNGVGMTRQECEDRWRTLSYEREKIQGRLVRFPDSKERAPRTPFGRNGVGRFAGFCFGSQYYIETTKNGRCCIFKVSRGVNQPISIQLLEEYDSQGHGTSIYVKESNGIGLPSKNIRTEIGLRFVADPDFLVFVDKQKVGFAAIPDKNIQRIDIVIDKIGTVKITIIDNDKTHKTTQLHGIAWHVNHRLVGEPSWKWLQQGDDNLASMEEKMQRSATLLLWKLIVLRQLLKKIGQDSKKKMNYFSL